VAHRPVAPSILQTAVRERTGRLCPAAAKTPWLTLVFR
jgi:hypothetical protein